MEFQNFEETTDGHIIVRVKVGSAFGARIRAILEARVATLPGSSINGELKNWLQKACDTLIAKARKAQPGNKDVANTPEAVWLAIPILVRREHFRWRDRPLVALLVRSGTRHAHRTNTRDGLRRRIAGVRPNYLIATPFNLLRWRGSCARLRTLGGVVAHRLDRRADSSATRKSRPTRSQSPRRATPSGLR